MNMQQTLQGDRCLAMLSGSAIKPSLGKACCSKSKAATSDDYGDRAAEDTETVSLALKALPLLQHEIVLPND